MSPFIQQFDQNSGKYYWFDRVTGQSQWQQPSLSHGLASTPDPAGYGYNNSSTTRYQDSDLDHDSPPSYSQSLGDLSVQHQSSSSAPLSLLSPQDQQLQFTSSSGRQYHYYPPSSNYSPLIPAHSRAPNNNQHQQQHMQMQSAHPHPQLQPQHHQDPYTYSSQHAHQNPIVVYRGNPTTIAVIGLPRLFPFFF